MAAKKPTKKVIEVAVELEETVVTTPVEEAPKLNAGGWRDPASVYADDDTTIDARMWRLVQARKRVESPS